MSHYDCKNCGHHLGIDWGYCENCTPDEYLQLKETLKQKKKEIIDKEMRHHEKYAREIADILTRDIQEEMENMERPDEP